MGEAAMPFLIGGGIGLAAALGAAFVGGTDGAAGSRGKAGRVSNGHMVTRRDHQAYVPRIYGQCRVGVNQVYMHTTGGSNKHLHMICDIGEGPIAGIVREDGTRYETTASALPTSNPPLIYFDDILWKSFPAKSRLIQFFDGAADQGVCTALQAHHSEWTDAKRYTSYLYIRLEYDRDIHMSEPSSIMVVVDGLECYDPITEATGWTANPAICAYNYMTTPSSRGGMGMPTSVIDTSSLSDLKDYCDTKEWTANLSLHEDKPDADHLQMILNGARAKIIPAGEYIGFRYLDLNYESVVMNLTAADIVTDSDGAEQIDFGEPDIIDRPNTVRAKYLNGEDYKYIVDDYVHPDEEAIADDGGDIREMTVNVHGLSDINLVQKMAYYHLERARYNRVLSGTFGRRCTALEPTDLITLTFEPYGWNSKYFRVKTVAPQEDFTVQLVLEEESLALYDDVYDPGAIEWYDTDLPSPTDAVLSVINCSISEETYPERGRSRSRIVVDFDPPSVGDYPYWDHAEVWAKRGESGTWEFKTKAGQNDSNSNYTLDPVEEGETYFIKMVSVSILGQKETFDTALTLQHTVMGLDSDPGDLSALTAIANASGVTLFADWDGDDDAANFEIRIGASWNDGVTVMVAPAHNNNLRATINGVRPGTHTFWAAVLNNAGRYSSTPVSASVTVFIPPGYTELPTYGTWSWDYSTGTFSNAAATTHTFDAVSHDALQCSHASDVLTGTWQSPTYDLGAVEKVKVWGDFIFDLDSSDKVWSNNFPTSTAWEDLGIDGKTWSQIFSLQESGKVRAKLLAKDTDSAWDSATEYEFFEMQCVEIENRYVRVEIEITDPNTGSNIYVKELNMYAYEGQT